MLESRQPRSAYQEVLKQVMFATAFLVCLCHEGEQCDPKKGFSDAPEATEPHCRLVSDTTLLPELPACMSAVTAPSVSAKPIA